MKVLVVDDEISIRLLCRVNLEAEGMEVVEAKDGPTGLEEAKRTNPDVILLDVMMPGMDGPATLKALRAIPATAATPARRRKNSGLLMRLHKLPIKPDRKPPVKLVASHTPINSEINRAGATLVTNDRPTGDR